MMMEIAYLQEWANAQGGVESLKEGVVRLLDSARWSGYAAKQLFSVKKWRVRFGLWRLCVRA